MDLAGGCLCGAVRYVIRGDPLFAGHCFCTDCQKESGAGHLTFVSVCQEALTLSGDMCTYGRPADSGLQVGRGFCPACGTTVLGKPEAMPGIVMIRAGTLDDSSAVHPQLAVFAGSARPWDQPPAGMRAFPGMPPSR